MTCFEEKNLSDLDKAGNKGEKTTKSASKWKVKK